MTTYTVTVVSTGGGNKYFIDGVQQASLSLIINNSFTFNQDAASNDGHPLLLSATSDGTHNSGTRYDTNVVYTADGGTVSASDYISNFNSYTTRSITISVVAATPSLFYYCNYHSGMGGSAAVTNPLQGWGRQGWNDGTWGGPVPVSVTGLSSSFTLGTESVEANALAEPSGLSMTTTLGSATAEQESIFTPTGLSFETQLSGVLVQEGAGVVLPSLSMAFTAGDETTTGTVDAGWGRSTWGSFAWNENIEFITEVTGVAMSTTLGTPTIEVGTGVIVTPTPVTMSVVPGSLSVSGATALVSPTSVTMSMALSGATVSGEGSVAVIAPSDQLDFNIGSVVIDIFTQIDPVGVTMTATAGTATVTTVADIVPAAVTMATALGTPTIEVGTGVIVSVSTVALSFAEGTTTTTGGAIVNVTGVDLSIVTGNPFATPWANVVTGASNTWTEVDAA